MSSKKKFCILEQGKSVGDSMTKEHQDQFTTEDSDFYRLNWKQEDPDALVVQPGICWSEGRSLLYEKIPKIYDYYIFIDDDVRFLNPNPANLIAETLKKYKPVAGCFYERAAWHSSRMQVNKEATPIAGFDLNNHIFSREAATALFPVTHHGSGRVMWYAQYVVHKLYPRKQMMFSNILVDNWRHEPPEDKGLEYYTPVDQVVAEFNKDLIEKEDFIRWDHEFIMNLNRSLSSQLTISDSEVKFSMEDFAKIYDINNVRYINRKSLHG